MPIVFPNNTIQEVSAQQILFPQNVVQVVDVPITATLSVNNWATQNTLATATITPTSTTSRILVYTQITYRQDAAFDSWNLAYIWVFNNTRNAEIMRSGWNGNWRFTINHWQKQFLDTPNSTAPQVYSVRVGNYPTGVAWYNFNAAHDGLSFIRLTEFGA